MISPSDHYQALEYRVDKLSEFRDIVAEVRQYARRKSLKVFWRGQKDATWGLRSSLSRQISAVTTLDDALLNRVEDQILAEAAEWILDFKRAKFRQPLARLGYLQHHGVPTRLIDFTRDPWIALFFASEGLDQLDGRIFALLVNETDVIANAADMPGDTPWRNYGSDEIRVWDPISCSVRFPRLVAQHGVFTVGRLPSTSPYRSAFDSELKEERGLLAEEVRSILSVSLKLCPSIPIPANATPPIGLTFRIHVNKESIRRSLSKRPGGPRICQNKIKIDHKLVYPDSDGMRTHSQFLIGLNKNTLILP